MKGYGMTIQAYLTSKQPLFDVLTQYTRTDALAIYSFASFHDLYDVAAVASTHLLSIRLTSLPERITSQIHPVYFKRLALLQSERVQTFKSLLATHAPSFHDSTIACSMPQQKDRIIGTWNHIVDQVSQTIYKLTVRKC